MAVTNRNSNTIANTVATPRVANSPGVGGAGMVRAVSGYVANAADDSATSIQRFVRVPSNARILQVLLSTGDASTAGAADVGVYQTSENGGAVVDADLFASAFALTNGPYDNYGLTYESGEYTLAESITPLWQALGLSADPVREYDIASTITTTYSGAAVGQLLTVLYVV